MFTVLAGAAMAQQPVDYVDPFIGTTKGLCALMV